jgi:hypothetical protein
MQQQQQQTKRGNVYSTGQGPCFFLAAHHEKLGFVVVFCQDMETGTLPSPWPDQIVVLTGENQAWEMLLGVDVIPTEQMGILFTAKCLDNIPDEVSDAVMCDPYIQKLAIERIVEHFQNS